MNKLFKLMAKAENLATLMPNAGEVLYWRSDALAQAVDTWYQSQAIPGEVVMLVDTPLAQIERFREAGRGSILLSDGRMCDTSEFSGWRVSQRRLSDVALDESAVLEAARAASSLNSLRDVLDQDIAEPWCASGSIERIVAPFLLNRGSDDVRRLALREAVRVLGDRGHLESVVLAADEALTSRRLSLCG